MSRQVLLLMLIFIGCLAITPSRGQISLFIQGGYTSARVQNLDDPNGTLESPNLSVRGYSAGTGIRIPVVKKWQLFIQAEFSRTQKGYATEYYSDGEGLRPGRVWSFRITTTEFPLLLRKEFLSGKIRPYVEVGPSLFGSHGDKVNTTLTVDGIAYSQNKFGITTQQISDRYTERLERPDFAWNAGAGVAYRFNRFEVNVGYRYNYGMSRLY